MNDSRKGNYYFFREKDLVQVLYNPFSYFFGILIPGILETIEVDPPPSRFMAL